MKISNILIALVFAFCVACSGIKSDHGHSHASDGGHSHDHDDSRMEAFTIWTDHTELFVEFPVLVVNQFSRFNAHFTVLKGHQPVREGSVTVSLIKGVKGIRHTVGTNSSPGIFTPSLQPKEAGLYQLVFDLNTPAYSDRIVLNGIQVFATAEEAEKGLEGEMDEGNVISFLKEQAWKIDFQTVPVNKKMIHQSIPTSGIWKVAPSDYQTLVAPATGRVSLSSELITKGKPVKKGQVLMTIKSAGLSANNLSAEVDKAKVIYEQLKSEYERKKELHESKIIADADFELAEQKYLVAKTNFETLNSGYGAGGKMVKSPISGFIKSIQIANGEFVEQGRALVTVTSHSTSLLEVQVSPRYAAEINNIQDVWYQPKIGHWSSLIENGGKILSVGKEVDLDQPLISIYAQVNEGVEMPEGSFTEAQIGVGEAKEGLVIPESSLLEDYGRYSVIVQLSGEGFEQREVELGKRNGKEVEILKGLSLGEMVVSIGAYQVKMASMSGQAPAHGHAH